MKPVLVVDDEPQMRSLVKALLSEEGFNSIEASDGCSAYATLKKLDGEISLVLTDVNMPCGMDGIDLAGAVKAEFPEIPVLVVSSRPSPPTDRDGIGPAYAFVRKPFELKVFAETVRNLISRAADISQFSRGHKPK